MVNSSEVKCQLSYRALAPCGRRFLVSPRPRLDCLPQRDCLTYLVTARGPDIVQVGKDGWQQIRPCLISILGYAWGYAWGYACKIAKQTIEVSPHHLGPK